MELTAKYDDWLNDLFKDERNTTTDCNTGTQNGRSRRLSVGASSHTICLSSSKSALPGKLIRRQKFLPSIRKKLLIDPLKQLETEENREHHLENNSISRKPHKVILAISKDAISEIERFKYSKTLFYPVPTKQHVAHFLPGISFGPLLAMVVKGLSHCEHKSAPTLRIPRCLVITRPEILRPAKSNIPIRGYFINYLNSCENDETAFQVIQEADDMRIHVNKFFDATSMHRKTNGSGYPVAVVKRSWLENCHHKTTCAFVFSKDEILAEISRESSSHIVGVQPYIKSKGSKPWCLRVQCCNNLCKKLWMLTSVLNFNPCDDNNTPPPVYCDTKQGLLPTIATRTCDDGNCSIVQTSMNGWTIPVGLSETLAVALLKYANLPVRDMTLDFTQDENGEWWLLQVKNIQLKDAVDAKEHNSIQILQPRQKPQKVVMRDIVTSRCPGAYCDKVESIVFKQILKRDMILDRIASYTENLKESELVTLFSAKEHQEQGTYVRVCESCYHAYKTVKEKMPSEARLLLPSKRSEEACIRLYDQFAQMEKQKFVANATMIISALEVPTRKKKKKKAREKAIETTTQVTETIQVGERVMVTNGDTCGTLVEMNGSHCTIDFDDGTTAVVLASILDAPSHIPKSLFMDAAELLVDAEPPEMNFEFEFDEENAETELQPAPHHVGVLCLFGCGDRITCDSEALTKAHSLWTSHKETCPAFFKQQYKI